MMTENPLIPSEEQLNNAVDRYKNRAEVYMRDPEKSRQLLDRATKKAERNEPLFQTQPEFLSHLKAFFRLLRAYLRREYTAVPWGSLLAVMGAIIYFVSPIDLLLDWIPVAGFVDDAAVLVLVFRQVRNDLNKFLKWEYERTIPPPIIDL